MRHLRALLSVFLVCLIALQCLPASACSFSTTVYFTYSTHPDIPLAPYARGRLGIVLKPYARSYLVVAYRYLQNKPLSADEQKSVLQLWSDRMGYGSYSDCEDASGEWLKARAAIAGLKKPDAITVQRPVVAGSYNTYCNCLPDGFRQAVVTLKDRATKYGAASDTVKQWVQAQDQVFANCGFAAWGDKPAPAPTFPSSLPATADQLSQQDRAYQIASAHFYAKDFDTAHKDFLAISQDAQSPYKTVARYLAARSLVRKGMLSKEEGYEAGPLELAQTELVAMIADSSMEKFRQDIQNLLRFVQVRVAPATVIGDLSAALNKQITPADLNEYTRTIDTIAGGDDSSALTGDYDAQPAAMKADEMTDWMVTLESTGPQSASHAIQMWRSKQSLPWLVAAASKLDAKSHDSADMIAAIEKLPNTSPAYWTGVFHLNDLQIARGEGEVVRKRLNGILDVAQPELPPSARNLFRSQRLQLARNLDEFMRDAFQKPVCLCGSGFIDEVPDDVDKLEKAGKYPDLPVHIPYDTEGVIDGQFPLSVWLRAVQSPYSVQPIKRRFLWSGLTRALLLKNDAAAKKFAELIKPTDAKNAPLLTTYLTAQDAKSREFAGAFILLRNNRSVPQLGYGDYDEGEQWWWASQPGKLPEDQSFTDLGRPKPQAGWLTAAEKTESAAELKALNAVPTAPNYLTAIAIAWAKAHPTDPRVPEALHLAVRTTRYGATTEATPKLSKEAFGILHTRYKGNPWTAKTPYYY